MKYTKNHHLPQWEESDRILMSDFNKMAQDLEAALDKTKAAVDSASALAQQGVDKAETAQQTANKNLTVEVGRTQVRRGTPATITIPNASQYNEFTVMWLSSQPYKSYMRLRIYINNDRDDKGKYHGGTVVPTARKGIVIARMGDHCTMVSNGLGVFTSVTVHRLPGDGADTYKDCTVYDCVWSDIRSLVFEQEESTDPNQICEVVVYGRMN